MKIKISIIILVFFILSVVLPCNYIYATSIEGIFSSADNFLGKGSSQGKINDEKLQSTSNFLYKLLLTIGIIVMVFVGTILGIKFMVSSVEDKAKVKEMLVPYIIGCAVILGAFTICSMVVTTGQKIFPVKAGPTEQVEHHDVSDKIEDDGGSGYTTVGSGF